MAVNTFPELSDLVAADLYAGSALWRYPDLCTTVLRLCYTLGSARAGTLASYLRGPRVPTVLGFDPLFQFIHDLDAARAICTSVESKVRGVFNVAGPSPLPLSTIIRETARRNIPVPETLFRFASGRFGLPKLPKGAIEHIKYPVIIDDGLFRSKTGFEHKLDESTTMADFVS